MQVEYYDGRTKEKMFNSALVALFAAGLESTKKDVKKITLVIPGRKRRGKKHGGTVGDTGEEE